MTIAEELSEVNTLFIDTAPIIYFIEAHPLFGPLAKEVFDSFLSHGVTAFSSVITLAEVLPKPVQAGDEKLARKFSEFLEHGNNLNMIEIATPGMQADCADGILSCGRWTPFNSPQPSTSARMCSSRTTTSSKR